MTVWKQAVVSPCLTKSQSENVRGTAPPLPGLFQIVVKVYVYEENISGWVLVDVYGHGRERVKHLGHL